jgi:hypothetical protein
MSGAQTSLVATRERDALLVTSAFADSTGHAVLEAAPGSYYLRVQHLGYSVGDSEVTLTPGVELSIGATIALHVVCD